MSEGIWEKGGREGKGGGGGDQNGEKKGPSSEERMAGEKDG